MAATAGMAGVPIIALALGDCTTLRVALGAAIAVTVYTACVCSVPDVTGCALPRITGNVDVLGVASSAFPCVTEHAGVRDGAAGALVFTARNTGFGGIGGFLDTSDVAATAGTAAATTTALVLGHCTAGSGAIESANVTDADEVTPVVDVVVTTIDCDIMISGGSHSLQKTTRQ